MESDARSNAHAWLNTILNASLHSFWEEKGCCVSPPRLSIEADSESLSGVTDNDSDLGVDGSEVAAASGSAGVEVPEIGAKSQDLRGGSAEAGGGAVTGNIASRVCLGDVACGMPMSSCAAALKMSGSGSCESSWKLFRRRKTFGSVCGTRKIHTDLRAPPRPAWGRRRRWRAPHSGLPRPAHARDARKGRCTDEPARVPLRRRSLPSISLARLWVTLMKWRSNATCHSSHFLRETSYGSGQS